VLTFVGYYSIIAAPPGMRAPAWAARAAMLSEGAASQEDIERWGAAFDRIDASPARPTIFAPTLVAVGRRE
jgi:hypothetical protein